MSFIPHEDYREMQEAVADAMRKMLGDNPCVLLEDPRKDPDARIYFSNPQLFKAFEAGLRIHNQFINNHAKRLHKKYKE